MRLIRNIFLTVAGAILLIPATIIAAWVIFRIASPSFEHVPDERSKLINGILSYQSTAEVLEILGFPDSSYYRMETEPGYTYQGIQHLLYANVPSQELIVVPRYSHLGCEGTLDLYFLNNRLLEALFVPKQFDLYIAKLAEIYPQLIARTEIRDGTKKIMTDSFSKLTIIYKDITYEGRTHPDNPRVVWADTRLVEERYWIPS